jgi:hypothetical protein
MQNCGDSAEISIMAALKGWKSSDDLGYVFFWEDDLGYVGGHMIPGRP